MSTMQDLPTPSSQVSDPMSVAIKRPVTLKRLMTGEEAVSKQHERGLAFWLIFVVLAVVSFLSSLEASVIGVALPRIVTDLHGERVYIWFITAYLITAAAFMPIWGQLADIFGRRSTLMASIIFFTLGSGIAGGARNAPMLIAARVVQGIGGAGQLTLTDIIISDIVSLRERGKFVGIIGAVWSVGTVIGPIIGGALANAGQWRWIFYLNVPLAGIALLMAFVFLRVVEPEGTIISKIKKLDFIGATIFLGSLISIQLALATGGVDYEWSQAQVLTPLIVGFAGLGLFVLWITYAKRINSHIEPLVPVSLFSERTASIGFMTTFLHGILVFGVIYMLPIYFEGVKGSSALRAGVQQFPFTFIAAPCAAIGGIIISVTGNYKIINIGAFVLMVIGLGLFHLISSTSPDWYWIVFQLVLALGAGAMFVISLPPIQAAVKPREIAGATALYAFMRNAGAVFGLAVSTALFNHKVDVLVVDLPAAVQKELVRGGAFAIAAVGYNIFGPFAAEVKDIAVIALRDVWWALFSCAVLGFLVSLFYKNISLSKILDTEYGIDEKQHAPSTESV